MRVLLLLAALCATGQALDNGAALTPPMGWNSWNHFGGGVSSQIMRDTASRLVDLGLAKVGYVHVNSDDCWLNRNRSADGSMVPTDKFGGSAGMLNLLNHLHSMGLKFGLYGAAGEPRPAARLSPQAPHQDRRAAPQRRQRRCHDGRRPAAAQDQEGGRHVIGHAIEDPLPLPPDRTNKYVVEEKGGRRV